jgi:seryl-tRNA synthetase
MDEVDFSELLTWDKERRELLVQVETLQSKRNSVSKEIAQLKKQGKDAEEYFGQMKELANTIKEQEERLNVLEEKIKVFVEKLPNLPDEDVLPGGKENNKVIREWGKRPEFSFKPKDHMDLVKMHDLIDYERGVKLGGNGYWVYKGYGAILEWALLN